MLREIEKKYLIDGEQGHEAMLANLEERLPGVNDSGESEIVTFFYHPPAREQVIEVISRVYEDPDVIEHASTLLEASSEFMVKIRTIDGLSLFAIKGSEEGTDPIHATSRLEFEEPTDTSFEVTEEAMSLSGIVLASKWRAIRRAYDVDNGLSVQIQFVDGYGYTAEIEAVVVDGQESDQEQAIDRVAELLGVVEPADGLFAKAYRYYQEHWEEYYETGQEFPPEVWEELGREIA